MHAVSTLFLVALVALVNVPFTRGEMLRGANTTARKLVAWPTLMALPTPDECAMAGGIYAGICHRIGNKPQTFTYEGDNGDKTVLFKYGELVERAKQYKLSIKDTADDHEVYVYFAVYKLALNVWTCVDPTRSTYGTTYGWGSGCTGEGDDKLIYKFVDAARAGVQVRIVFHNPDGIPARGSSDEPDSKIWDYLTTDVSSLPSTFQIHRADWKSGTTSGQMHNKFLLVSHHKTPNYMIQDNSFITRFTHSTYVTTQNVDYYGSDTGSSNTDLHLDDYVQTGVLVRNDEDLYNHYVKYFETIWEHTLPASLVVREEDALLPSACITETTCTRGFRERMRELHENVDDPINYDGGDIQAFFYPLPNLNNIWDTDFNAVAKFVDDMDSDTSSSMRYFKMNMYHFKDGEFVTGLLGGLRKVPYNRLHARVVYTKDSSTYGTMERVRANPPNGGDLSIRFHGDEKQMTHPYLSGQIRSWSPGSNKKSHAKNYQLYYQGSEGTEWVTITGSTNGKDDAYNRKANNQIVFVERERQADGTNPPIYEAHKVALYKSY